MLNDIPINPQQEEDTLVQAVQAILSATKRLQQPWSLAELQSTEDDYLWLCNWAASLSSQFTEKCLTSHQLCDKQNYVTYDQAFGLIFLLFATERGRREATEGEIWPHLYKTKLPAPGLCFPKTTTDLLFVQGQPTSQTKDAIEKAAYRFGLRHVFGKEGVQNWLITIYLQFGFTRRGFLNNLSPWLMGYNLPTAVNLLRSGNLRSASFNRLFTALLELRNGNIIEARCRQILQQSPWVLPDWKDDLIRQARRQIDRPALTPGTNEIPFLDEPVLQWIPGTPPGFSTKFINLALQPLEAEHYQLFVGANSVASLYRQSDGTYAPPGDGSMTLPLCPQIQARLLVGEEERLSQTLTLFDSTEEVTVFYLPDGRRHSDAFAKPIQSNSAIALLLADDLTVEPPPAHFHRLGQSGRKLFYVSRDTFPQCQVYLEGELLWSPVLNNQNLQNWAKEVRLEWVHLSTQLPRTPMASALLDAYNISSESGNHCFTIHCPNEIQVCRVRVAGQEYRPLSLSSLTPTYGPLPVSLGPSVTVTIQLEHTATGQKTTLQKRLGLNDPQCKYKGVMRQTEQGWEELGSDKCLRLWESKTDSFWVSTPPDWNNPVSEDSLLERPCLMEGSMWVGRLPKHRTCSLGRLNGWGANLEVRNRPYNFVDSALPLAGTVLDTGILQSVTFEDASVYIDLYTTPDLTDYQLLWWGENGNTELLPVQEKHGKWYCLCPENAKAIALVLVFEGVRTGAWWATDWDKKISHLFENQPRRTAALLRWAKLPLLSVGSKLLKRQEARMDRILQGWLMEGCLPSGLVQRNDSIWPVVVRTLLADWKPNADIVNKLLHRFSGQTKVLSGLRTLIERFLPVCPIVLARIVRVVLQDIIIPKESTQTAKKLLKKLQCEIASLPAEASNETLQNRQAELIQQIIDTMGVADTFITNRNSGLLSQGECLFHGESITSIHRDNVAVALASVEPLRRLMLLHLLEKINL